MEYADYKEAINVGTESSLLHGSTSAANSIRDLNEKIAYMRNKIDDLKSWEIDLEKRAGKLTY